MFPGNGGDRTSLVRYAKGMANLTDEQHLYLKSAGFHLVQQPRASE